MTNEEKRAFYRSRNIDIEIQPVVTAKDGKFFHTGHYKFVVSKWDSSHHHIRNFYSSEVYTSYEAAEDVALDLAVAVFEGREEIKRDKYI